MDLNLDVGLEFFQMDIEAPSPRIAVGWPLLSFGGWPGITTPLTVAPDTGTPTPTKPNGVNVSHGHI